MGATVVDELEGEIWSGGWRGIYLHFFWLFRWGGMGVWCERLVGWVSVVAVGVEVEGEMCMWYLCVYTAAVSSFVLVLVYVP